MSESSKIFSVNLNDLYLRYIDRYKVILRNEIACPHNVSLIPIPIRKCGETIECIGYACGFTCMCDTILREKCRGNIYFFNSINVVYTIVPFLLITKKYK